jgi:PhnB protein
MASVSTYLNFRRESEEAFNFYAQVFGTEIMGIMRHGDVPDAEIPDEDRNLVMNAALPILGGHLLMATDIPESMGMELKQGNNVQICLHPDTRGEADKLHAALAEGGSVGQKCRRCSGATTTAMSTTSSASAG